MTASDSVATSSQASIKAHAQNRERMSLENGEPNWCDDNEDFDKICENSEDTQLGDLQQQHGSVLMHMLSQVFLIDIYCTTKR